MLYHFNLSQRYSDFSLIKSYIILYDTRLGIRLRINIGVRFLSQARLALSVLFAPAIAVLVTDAYGIIVYGFNSLDYYVYRFNIVLWIMMFISLLLIPISIKLYERSSFFLDEILGAFDKSRLLEILALLFITISIFALQEYLTSMFFFKSVEDYGNLLRALYTGFPLILRYIYALVYPVVITVGEEMFFRGYGVKVLSTRKISYSYVIASIAYGLWYGIGMPFYLLGAVILGLVYSFFYLNRGLSLKSIILAHYLALLIGCANAI